MPCHIELHLNIGNIAADLLCVGLFITAFHIAHSRSEEELCLQPKRLPVSLLFHLKKGTAPIYWAKIELHLQINSLRNRCLYHRHNTLLLFLTKKYWAAAESSGKPCDKM